MNKVLIITDSTSDLGSKRCEALGVKVLPLFVNFTDEEYLDGQNITTEELYEIVERKNELPKTAAIPMDTFIKVFKEETDKGFDIVFTGISKAMSRTYENAVLAARELELLDTRVFVVDSMNLSSGIGLLVLKACKRRDEGMDAKTIAEKMNEDNKKVLSQFAIETMEYLHKGGRCSSVAAIFGSILKIKPIIAVRDGKMHVAKKPIGKMKVALDYMIKQIKEDKERVDLDHILITHSIAYESEKYIRAALEQEFPGVDIISTVAGCVISSHCGKGTIGILYLTK